MTSDKLLDRDGRTGQQFLRDLFEYENCEECSRGSRSHIAVPFLGNFMAVCKAATKADTGVARRRKSPSVGGI